MTCCLQMCNSQVGSKELQGLHAETIEKKLSFKELEVHRVIAMDLADVTWSNAEMSMKSTFMMRLTHELLDNVPNFSPCVFHMVWCRKPTEHE